MKFLVQKHHTHEIVKIVGDLISIGRGVYRPRIKANDFSGRVVIDGSAYSVKLRWPNGASYHEINPDIRPLGETDDSNYIRRPFEYNQKD